MAVSSARRWWAVGALALSALVVGLDTTVLNVALPTLATDLQASTSQLQWFANAYNLVFAAVLLPAGLSGDRFGRKKLLVAALVLFGAASVGCAYSGSTDALIWWRALLGLGAGFIFPLSLSVLPVMFDDEERPKAIGMVVTASALGLPLGPIVGGWLLDNFWWGSVFLINVPMVALAIVAVALLMPDSRSPEPPGLDLVGVLLSSAGLAGVTYGAIEAGEKGWGNGTTLALLIGGLVLVLLFVAWQRMLGARPGGKPLVDLSLFRAPAFTWGAVMAIVLSFALFGLLFTVPQYYQAVLGTDALGTGLRLLPIIGGIIVGARVGGKVAPKAGSKGLISAGFLLMAVGLFMGAVTKTGTSYGYAATWIAIVGLGTGLALPLAVDSALGALPTERSGVGSAVIQTVRQVGGTVGVAILGTVLTNAYHSHLEVGAIPAPAGDAARESVSAGVVVAKKLHSTSLLSNVQDSFVHGMNVMLIVCGAIAVVGTVLAVAFIPRQTVRADQGADGVAPTDAQARGAL
ncbi:MFS transporter [Streptomyces sp. FXJ1.172]|uniref:MFS transporter n=1 Tax=Streptomyces sp. FXJ1.172 TaxID=710705 RepID=UPI000D180FA1|nr:MFS transporter [Streptomyces sp. FXJ1.172]WEO99630.1 MFS transporter [Streptomyces sp. FXJ1.172]